MSVTKLKMMHITENVRNT